MLIAIDSNNERIRADDARKDFQYLCPICGNPVLLRHGQINRAHFAHRAGECTDAWNYDMSEWHRKMQGYFPIENQEIVVKAGSEIHRADVLVGNTVLEMQHSPITAEEFNARNIFFRNAGYRLAWIFDLRDRMECGQIDFLNCDSDHKYKWSNPMRIFSSLDHKLNDYDKKFALFFQLYDDCSDDEDVTYIEKVVWSAGSSDDEVDLTRFCTNDELVLGTRNFSIESLFASQEQLRRKTAQKAIGALNRKCKSENFTYTVKYSGVKEKNRAAYICPRTKKFGLDLFSETGCTYCQYCYMGIIRKNQKSTERAFYCCFPRSVRKLNGPNEGHPGYECDSIDPYLL